MELPWIFCGCMTSQRSLQTLGTILQFSLLYSDVSFDEMQWFSASEGGADFVTDLCSGDTMLERRETLEMPWNQDIRCSSRRHFSEVEAAQRELASSCYLQPHRTTLTHQRIVVYVACHGLAITCAERVMINIIPALSRLHYSYAWSFRLFIGTPLDQARALMTRLRSQALHLFIRAGLGCQVVVSGFPHPGWLLTALYRAYWKAHAIKYDYDWFLNTEDDIAWTHDLIMNVALEFEHFKAIGVVQGRKVVPGYLAYEIKSPSTPWRFLNQFGLNGFGPHIESMEWFEGEWFLVPSNPYQQGVLLPREDLLDFVLDPNWTVVESVVRTFRDTDSQIEPKVAYQFGVERYVSWWFYNVTRSLKMISLQRIHSFLAHHTSNVYVTPHARPNPSFPGVACWIGLAPLELLLAKLSVFMENPSKQTARAKHCKSACFPADFRYDGDLCNISKIYFRHEPCNRWCSTPH
eukprot:TRINITY_DN108178_c0_g1_i1.p1 TRINITY_DN108178_c0_g1~~TRINITY_DN108178_c0_g1_i1.p1  ORF type:complete len:464 (-),score=32.41 TRINITY_DN108178_c0_g1_i1:58-1449(-)